MIDRTRAQEQASSRGVVEAGGRRYRAHGHARIAEADCRSPRVGESWATIGMAAAPLALLGFQASLTGDRPEGSSGPIRCPVGKRAPRARRQREGVQRALGDERPINLFLRPEDRLQKERRQYQKGREPRRAAIFDDGPDRLRVRRPGFLPIVTLPDLGERLRRGGDRIATARPAAVRDPRPPSLPARPGASRPR